MTKEELIKILQHQHNLYHKTFIEKLQFYGCQISKMADEKTLMASFQGNINEEAPHPENTNTIATPQQVSPTFDTRSITEIDSIRDKIALLRGACN